MGIGKYNKRLVIQQPLDTQDASGAPVTAWVAFGTVWSSIAPIKGREATTAGQTLAAMDTRILIRDQRALDVLNTKWRGTYNGVIYNFTSVVRIDLANREIEILATSGLNQG
jgi:SPP1 family predicted phage head-tail adaptor